MSASTDRRQFLKYVGGSAALAGLTACGGGGGEPEAPPAASEPAAEPAAMPEAAPAEMPAEAPAAAPATANLVPLKDDDPQAQALGYVSDASTVDSTTQPRFEAGQACANCALFMGAAGDDSGPCSIFPGRLVAASGWCSVYAPKG